MERVVGDHAVDEHKSAQDGKHKGLRDGRIVETLGLPLDTAASSHKKSKMAAFAEIFVNRFNENH